MKTAINFHEAKKEKKKDKKKKKKKTTKLTAWLKNKNGKTKRNKYVTMSC